MPLLETKGAASAQGFGLTSAVAAAKYIEDYFQTWLRTGTGASATVTTGLNASINKSLVWTKSRSAATDHKFTDTVRGATKALVSNSTAAETTDSQGLTAFSSTGYTIGTNTTYNNSGATYVDWQFVATPKFFDVVTYTGNGVAGRQIAHSLGSVPGCIIVKRTDTSADWEVAHRSLWGSGLSINLNNTGAAVSGFASRFDTPPTASVFYLGTDFGTNWSGGTYVAYLFAHDAGGFGASGTDNVISCGSYTGTGSTPLEVNLGYEPQWVLIKRSDSAVSWYMGDVMRGLANTSSGGATLLPNTSDAETFVNFVYPTATGFAVNSTFSGFNASGGTYIYIAIRRGPMRTPTTGTSVFAPSTRTGTGATGTSTALGSVTDLTIIRQRATGTQDWAWTDRLRGATLEVSSSVTTLETAYTNDVTGFDSMTGFAFGSGASGQINSSGSTYIDYLLRRAPGFFDVVCYTGTGANRTVTHNLGVVPEFLTVRARSVGGSFLCYVGSLGATNGLTLNTPDESFAFNTWWNDTAPTSSVFTVGTGNTNLSTRTYVAYLFATVPGVSKVGSYTGTGATLQINCGFTGGARFVLIKRTDASGAWHIWDSARGIVAGNDPYILLNTTVAEVTSTDYVDTFSSGFEISSTAPAAINANGGTFIFLAIA
jgi:hypothetical protein